ncbi:hypothetical protein ACFYP0_07765 [Micromonospora arida]|uniref:HD domain-containing protein n=1 Tax=Micromonospora arida TaxID=2203715 RepID=UPI00367D17BB
MVEDYARQWRDAQHQLARAGLTDDWVDHDYPVRVTERVCQLVEVTGGEPPRISIAELGLLVAAPFLREAVLAEGLAEAAMIQPADFSRSHAAGARSDLEITHSIHQHTCHRAEGLASRGRDAERDMLAMWLVHRWLAGRQDIWESRRSSELCKGLAALVLDEPPTGQGLWTATLAGLLVDVLSGLGSVPGGQTGYPAGSEVPGVRPAALGALLSLAGVLAVDIRRLAPVVADHIGIRDAIDLDELRTTVTRLIWEPAMEGDTRTLDLRTVCAHPASHAALLEVKAQAEQVRAAAARLATLSDVDAVLLGGLPTAITANGVVPAGTDVRGQRRYETPLLRFRLSNDKIKELLMGRQLYGDPALALRELYQNALDACRYRQMRHRYQQAIGGPLPRWRGTIVFRQGLENGQPYIECSDNGVGMDAETLKNTFAQAGQRFIHGETFRQEQARWQRVDPELRLIPNSQFGIGVFSYFMLADEISLLTRPTDEFAEPVGETLRIDISSSGSLFRLQRGRGVPEGGTTVRLLLTGEEPVSVRRTLGDLVWLPEFDVEIHEAGRGVERWRANELRHRSGLPPVKVTERIWWVAGDGGLTADGIRTEETGYGYVVDLRDQQRPRFSVDRKTLRDWDRAWVAEGLSRGMPRLKGWPGLTLRWLWHVTESRPEVAQDIYEWMTAEGMKISLGGGFVTGGVEVDLGEMGCVPADRHVLVEEEELQRSIPIWLRRWRRALWAQTAQDGYSNAIQDVSRFPVLDPFDGHLLSRLPSEAEVTLEGFASLVSEVGWPAGVVHRRLLRYVMAGLDLSPLRGVLAVDLDNCPDHLLDVVLAAAVRPPREAETASVPMAVSLVLASAREQMPLREVIEEARPLLPPEHPLLETDLGVLGDHICEQTDAEMLSQDLDGFSPWIGSQVSFVHLLHVASLTGQVLEDVWANFERFRPLGYRTPIPAEVVASLTRVERRALINAGATATLSPLALFVTAGLVGVSTHDVSRQLSRLESLGMLRLPDPSTLPDLIPDPAASNFVQAMGTASLGRWQTAGAVVASLLLEDEDSGASIGKGGKRTILAFALPDWTVSGAQLIWLAAYTELPLFECLDRLQEHRGRGVVPESLVDLVNQDPDLRPRRQDLELLFVNDAAGPVWQLVSPAQLVHDAVRSGTTVGERLKVLQRYRHLGALLPQPPADRLAALHELLPNSLDLNLLRIKKGEDRFRISPLTLLRRAGSLGLRLRQAQERLDLYTLLGLEFDYDPADVPDDLVGWEDVILLTTHLDGAAPAVEGPVSEEHICRAADLLGVSRDWISERLQHYAPLFGLSVPDGKDIDG